MTRSSHAMRPADTLVRWLAYALLLTASIVHTQPAGNAANAAAPSNASPDAAASGSAEWIVGRADDWYDDPEGGTRRLTGKVKMEREDGTGYLYGDTVTMYHEPGGDSRTIDKTVAEGNVNLKEGEVVATCDRAEFTEGNNVIHLTGKVVVLLDRDRMECEDFTLDRRTGQRHGTGGVRFRVQVNEEPAEEEAPSEPNAEQEAATDGAPGPPADAQ